MMAAATGSSPNSDALVSTSWAEGPVTWAPERGREVADRGHQLLAGRREGLDRRHHRQPGAVGGGEAPRLGRDGGVGGGQRALEPGAVGVGAGEGVDPLDPVQPGQGGGVAVDVGQVGPRVADAGGDHREGAGLVGGEVVTDRVGHLAALGAGGQDPVVGQAEADAQERGAEQDQEGDHGQGDRDRPAHHPGGDPVPEPGPGLPDGGPRRPMGRRKRSTRRPSTASRAGSTTRAPTAARATTAMPA